MAKEVVAQIKLQIPAALGPRGVNIMAFIFVISTELEKSLNLK